MVSKSVTRMDKALLKSLQDDLLEEWMKQPFLVLQGTELYSYPNLGPRTHIENWDLFKIEQTVYTTYKRLGRIR